jgi:hypothetical protein
MWTVALIAFAAFRIIFLLATQSIDPAMVVFSPTLGPPTLVFRFAPTNASVTGSHLLANGAPVANGKVLSEVVAAFEVPNEGASSLYGYDYNGQPVESTEIMQRVVAYA